ncbi:MAG: prepilin-type N-terminal cleavage/methylation domain-containing protein [Candidatus Omnitrophica bacterium]|nr:prepilin-type N-terminal cleavage/methylation domain-containing protein [Candidatus Omnitrophota bacterium]
MKNRRGLTLMEVLLAISIGTMVMLTVYKSFSLGVSIYNRLGRNPYTDAQRIIYYLQKDLRSAFIYTENNSPIAFSGSPNSLQFVACAPLNPAIDEADQNDFDEIKYSLQPSPKEGLLTLKRQSKNYLTADTDKQLRGRTLSKGIKSFELGYLNEGKWLDSWNSSGAFPQAVQVKISFAQSKFDNEPDDFETIIDLGGKQSEQ